MDYPKKILDIRNVKEILSDSVIARQIGFQRTLETYITADKYDMVSTHLLIYDVSDLYNPKILTGLRLVYEERCRHYGLTLPLGENLAQAEKKTKQLYEDFKSKTPNLAESIGWFVDKDFSYEKTKVDLAQILYFSLATFLMRQNITSCSGATNERYKASRWIEKIGYFQDGHLFNHPSLPYPHKATLVEYFYNHWLEECFDQYGHLLHSSYELLPDDSKLKSIDEIEKQIRNAAESERSRKAS